MVAPTRARVAARTARPPATASMIGLQRSAGNAAALTLLRRARKDSEESPLTLTIPGVVDRATVFSWSLGGNPRPTDLSLTRPTDSDSPLLFRAVTDGATGTATLLVRKLTALGWIHEMTLTLEDCAVSSYQAGENDESVRLTFTGMRVQQ